MLKKFNGSSFKAISPIGGIIVEYYRSKTDKRFVLDVVAPGFTADDVNVTVNGDMNKIKVELDPNRRPPLDADGDPDDFAYNAVKMANLTALSETFDIDPEIYDVADLIVSAHAGVIRIQAHKFSEPWLTIPIYAVD